MFLMVAFLAVGFVACGGDTTTEEVTTVEQTTEEPTTEEVTTSENSSPVIAGVEDAIVALQLDGTFDPLDGVTATDEEDGDLTDEVTFTGTVNLSVTGDYTLVYSVQDEDGAVTTATRVVTVELQTYANGFYNYKFASTELRHTFMAIAENYLLHNMYAGVPLFDSGSYVMYDSRVSLPVSEYVPVMGYGAIFGSMTNDDSTVLMDDGNLGDAGVYTYRTTIGANPGTFNQWLYDTSTDSTMMGYYYDAPYVYHYTDDKTGYAVVPSMATAAPVSVDGRTTETGKEVSYTWEFTLRDDLEWFFHPDTNAAFIATLTPADYEITATDFVETFKLALEEKWFRAVSGGGDFVTSSQAIVNAGAFSDGTTAWENVGIKIVGDDDLTIQFTFIDEQSEWNVRYWLSSFVTTPINLELYDYLLNDGDTNTNYGTTNLTIGYTGAYYVDYYEADLELIYLENPSYHNPTEYFYDSILMYVKTDPDLIWAMFEEGLLDGAAIPTAKYYEVKDYPGVMPVPGATIYRMMINGLGTVEAQQEMFPDSDWVPEPILANQDFKLAMSYAIDREYLATVVMKTRQPSIYLFSTAYLVDPEMGIAYRETEQGLTVATDMAPDTFGYNFDAARALYEIALDQLVADGVYQNGTAANPTYINIEFNVFADSESQEAMAEYIVLAFETAFRSSNHYIYVNVDWYPKDYPGIYYDYMMVGDFDLSVGGISGSTLDAASFLDTYCSDNRSGFTLNWGIDTSVAEIPINFTDDYGVERYELWSFDAIVSALNGEIFLIDGEEAEIPAARVDDITPTTVTFTIAQFGNVAYDNITYTVQYYDINDDAYYDLPGYIDIVPTAGVVTVEGLVPYFYGYDATHALTYQGDYQIVVNFEYKQFEGKSGSSTCPWFTTDPLFGWGFFPEDLMTLDATSAILDLTVEDYDAAITSVVVYLYVTPYTTDAGATIDFTDKTAVSITGLTAGTAYVVYVTYDDGNWDGFKITTPAA